MYIVQTKDSLTLHDTLDEARKAAEPESVLYAPLADLEAAQRSLDEMQARLTEMERVIAKRADFVSVAKLRAEVATAKAKP